MALETCIGGRAAESASRQEHTSYLPDCRFLSAHDGEFGSWDCVWGFRYGNSPANGTVGLLALFLEAT